MKTTVSGHTAETAVAKYLTSQGFELLSRNWRTASCEIDLVMRQEGAIYFVEVKYRGSSSQGEGFDYITAKKIRQMRYGAEIWVQNNNWAGDYRLCAAAVSGPGFESIRVIELD